MTKLKRSKDRKVANLIINGNIQIKNAFGLPAGKSCPGMTSVCALICYADKIETFRSAVRALVMHNFQLLKECRGSIDKMEALLDEMILDFIRDCERLNAPKKFRIHWDGDFFSTNYTKAWVRVIEKHDDVEFWAYTRVEGAAMILKDTRVTLYFSADNDNIEIARRLIKHGVLIAYLADTFDDAKDKMMDLNIRAVKCPENNKKIPLSTDTTSACLACGVCIEGRNNVMFSRLKDKPRNKVVRAPAAKKKKVAMV